MGGAKGVSGAGQMPDRAGPTAYVKQQHRLELCCAGQVDCLGGVLACSPKLLQEKMLQLSFTWSAWTQFPVEMQGSCCDRCAQDVVQYATREGGLGFRVVTVTLHSAHTPDETCPTNQG